MTWSSRLFAAGTIAMLFGVVGCARSTVGSWGVTSGATSQRDDGVMYSYSALHLARNGQIYTLLATARGTGNTYRGGEGTFHGELHAEDGVKISWSCTTKDGQNGKVIIDDQEFDLAAGALFLVSTSDKSAHVRQVAIDSAQLQTCSDVKKLLAVMKANPDMASYLALCKVGE
jgi:hypothetical protein